MSLIPDFQSDLGVREQHLVYDREDCRTATESLGCGPAVIVWWDRIGSDLVNSPLLCILSELLQICVYACVLALQEADI